MQLEQGSTTILLFPRERRVAAAASSACIGPRREQFINLAFTAIVFTLAALWLVFPPAQLSKLPVFDAKLAQDFTDGVGPH
jgi:hypothetical protein